MSSNPAADRGQSGSEYRSFCLSCHTLLKIRLVKDGRIVRDERQEHTPDCPVIKKAVPDVDG